MKSIHRNNSGFTLLELVAVTVLIAMLAGMIGVTGIKRYQARNLEATARRFYNLARYARYLAINRHAPCKLILDTEKRQIYLNLQSVDQTTGQVRQVIVKDRYCKPIELPASISLDNIQIMSFELAATYDSREDANHDNNADETQSQKVISYLPDGSADAALISITNGKKSYTLTIEPGNARPRIHNGAVDQLEQSIIDLDLAS